MGYNLNEILLIGPTMLCFLKVVNSVRIFFIAVDQIIAVTHGIVTDFIMDDT